MSDEESLIFVLMMKIILSLIKMIILNKFLILGWCDLFVINVLKYFILYDVYRWLCVIGKMFSEDSV